MRNACLDLEFYSIPASAAARALLGMRLVRMLEGKRVSGRIIETEAYQGEEDQACHARAGRTRRTAIMYGPAGRAYIYFTYGMHWMLNVVCDAVDVPAAVLIRAVEPLEGLELIGARRAGVAARAWTDGPAKLCKAFGIDGALNGTDLTGSNGALWIEKGPEVPEEQVRRGPRIGISYAQEPWLSIPWRFSLLQGDNNHA